MKINTVGPNPNNPVLKIYLLQQAEAKQHIQHFQKLISQEQNMFLSQQQEVINMNRPPSFVAKQFDNGKPVPDLNQLTADIGSMQLGAIGMSNGPSSASQAAQAQIQPFASNAGSTGQSRLAQWKLDSAQHDKPDELHSKFNRAPGVNVKPNNCNSWSAGIGDTWDNGNSFKDPSNAGLLSTSAPNHHAQSFNQFGLQQVNEFEPGKAWKQSQLLKSNDPSSQPVSINKEQIAYWPSPNQPSPSGAESLVGSFASNSTWSFPGGNGGSSGGGSGNAGIGTPLNMEEHPVNGWPNSNLVTANGSEMWNRGKPKGPPPGLGQLNAAKSSSVNPWSPEETQPGNNTWIQNSANQSAFLLLRNLVQVSQKLFQNFYILSTYAFNWFYLIQIDSSTLKTLCMQHGSLQLFHFQQESGVALIKYTSRDQALKARSALNQFSFGNANVIAEIPSEQQVQQIQNALQQSSSGQSNLYTGSAPVDNISASNVTTNGWSSVGQSNSNALWSYSQMAIGPGNSSQSNVGANSGNGGSIWQTMDSNPSNLLPGNLLGEST